MRGFFSLDNPVWKFMGKLADVAILNLLFLVCSIPIVTIGPAMAAVYYVTLKLVVDEEGYTIKGFFHSFIQNLKQGIIITIILLAIGGFLGFDVYFYYKNSNHFSIYLAFFMCAIALIYACIALYIFPILARFNNSIKNMFLYAFMLSMKNLPKTILMLITTAAIIWVAISVPLFSVVGFALAPFVNSYIFVKVFEPYMPKEKIHYTPEELAQMSELEREEAMREMGLNPSLDTVKEPEEALDAQREQTEDSLNPPEE